METDPFDLDGSVKTPAQNILDRKESMGIPIATNAEGKPVGPFDLDQPNSEFNPSATYDYGGKTSGV
jgi:hypothetical protein